VGREAEGRESMGGRAVLAGIVAVATLVQPGPGVAAEGPTNCSFAAIFTLSPGLSVVANSGIFTSRGERGEITCDATQKGTFGAQGRYGTTDPDSCLSSGEGDGIQSWTIPVGDTQRHQTNPIRFTYGVLAAGGVISGHFDGPRFSGTFQVTITKGDCVTTPVTEVSIQGRGTMRN
jgi:hypothetical protein